MNSRVIPRIQYHYTNPGHHIAFSSATSIHDHYKRNFNRNIPLKAIKNALSEVDSYTLHREYKKPRNRNPFYVYEIREQVQMDLIDVRQLAKYNGGVNFLLAAIDVFTKRAWIEPMEDKSAKTCLRVINKIVENTLPPIRTILFDRVRKYCRETFY